LNIEIPFLPDIFGGTAVSEQRSDVISIENLDAIPSATVRSGQSIHLRAVVQNLQRPEYEKVTVTVGLFNDCGLFNMENSAIGEFCSGSNPPAYNKDTGMVECSTIMYPQSKALVQWKLTAKEVNVETQCRVGILARYNYTTYSTSSVTFVNKAELERIISEGKSFSETGTATIGEGPVKPYIEVLSQPIVIDADPQVKPENAGGGIMSLWIENKGGGILEIADSSSANGNVDLTCAQTPSKQFQIISPLKVCLDIASTENGITAIKTEGTQSAPISIKDCIMEHLKNAKGRTSLSFIGKSTPKYSCSIALADKSTLKHETTYYITSQIGYWYKFTKEIPITVQPRIKL
jgi:hypothetical protein